MLSCRKFCLVKAIFLLVLCISTISCNDSNKVTYDIRWVVLGDFGDIYVTMSFLDREDITKEYEFVLIPKKTKKISVEKGSRFFGDGYPFGVQVIINYKEEYAIEDGMIEIFLYNPKVEWVDGYYVMEKQKGVEAYFVEYFANGKMYTLVSRDNVLTITEEKEFVDTAAVLEAIHEEDFNFHDKLGAMINPDVPLGGYIVKSKVDTYFWLTTRQ